jgi:hypothetical protein
MKKLFAISVMLLSLQLNAQKNDYLWTMGFGGISNTIVLFSVNTIDFKGPTTLGSQFRPNSVLEAGNGISDEYGALQFYTNGFRIRNHYDQTMPNGEGLSPGNIANDYENTATDCYPANHGSLVIPGISIDSTYYLFHVGLEYGTTNSAYCNYLYYTIVDMRLNGGLGDVTDKNHALVKDTLIGGSGMAACKHANGRDWWIIMQQMYTNCFYKFLLTPHGIDTMGIQCIGDTVHFDLNRGSNVFTPDGSKYIWSNPYEHLNILDFDRCTGQFSNHHRYPIIDSLPKLQADGSVYLDGVAVSANSRYLYLSTISEVRQFDLTAPDILQSEIIIANTFLDAPKTSICFSQLAPDGKIYLVAFKQDTFLHVINNPNAAGAACGFVKNGLRLPAYNHTYLPNYPHYRLGALTGSACDTLLHTGITESNEDLYKLKVFPNPATNFVTIDYGFTDWNKGEVSLEITNELGQMVLHQPVPMYSGFQKVEVQNFAPGMYTAFIKRKGQVVATAKFARQ